MIMKDTINRFDLGLSNYITENLKYLYLQKNLKLPTVLPFVVVF